MLTLMLPLRPSGWCLGIFGNLRHRDEHRSRLLLLRRQHDDDDDTDDDSDENNDDSNMRMRMLVWL
jgi:hypothetical protein